MAVTDTKRAKKLVTFREVERDRASLALSLARAKTVSAEEAVNAQLAKLEEEKKLVSLERDNSLSTETMQLILACIEASRDDLREKEAQLNEAEAEVDTKMAALMETHKRMRQMEALLKKAGDTASKSARTKEQREIDDLAINRGARKK